MATKMRETDSVTILNLKTAEPKIIESLAITYCQVFNTKPWNENWQTNEVLEMLDEAKTLNGFQGTVAVTENKVVGFSWGYLLNREQMQKKSGQDELDYLFKKVSTVFYGAELAVLEEYRRYGIGKKLSKTRLMAAKQAGAKIAVIRTDKNAKDAESCHASIGFKKLEIADANFPNRFYWTLVLEELK